MGEQPSSDRRPSPDALLREAQKALRGRLKIFLGAAPGVGKTYEMLSAARTRRREGVVQIRVTRATELTLPGRMIAA
jgi:two-component system, OmpR family, sensor histidine kinase KdpD